MDGSLIIDKPRGITSHDVVARVRRAAATRRVGHAGTLDPFATGVLVVCVGRATRLVQFLVGLEKEYLATLRLGYATDTQDETGKQITPLTSSKELRSEDVLDVLKEFIGPQLQTPPMFSAKKVRGERLHRAAREGREVEREPARITVYSMDMVERDGTRVIERQDGTRDIFIRVSCSSGTYVRTLAHDIGQRLGVGAHLAELRRAAVGRFDLSSAVTVDEVLRRGDEGELEGILVSPARTVGHLPRLSFEGQDLIYIRQGRQIAVGCGLSGSTTDRKPWVRLCDSEGNLVAVGEFDRGSGTARPRVVLAPDSNIM
jgi:tRNA pseudouridine55 synthase